MGFNFDQDVAAPLKDLMADIALAMKDLGHGDALWGSITADLLQSLGGLLLDVANTRNTSPQGRWLSVNLPPTKRKELSKAASAAGTALFKTHMKLAVYTDGERAEAFKLVVGLLKQFLDTFQAIWKGGGSPAPKSFQFEGFKVLNPDRLSDWAVNQLLDTVVYAKALFKKRGMEDLLMDGINDVELVLGDLNGNYSGLYNSLQKRITLVAVQLLGHGSSVAATHRFVDEVFVHEFGHYVHMTYITGEARKFWDGTWAPVEEAAKQDREVTVLTLAMRKKFVGMILGYGGDVATVSKRLKSKHERLMFLGWLRIARFVKDNATQVRLTPLGELGVATMLDPDGELEKMLKRRYGAGKLAEVKADPVEWNKMRGENLNLYLRPLFLTSNKSMDIDFRNREYLDDLVAKIEGVVENKVGPAKARVTEEWGTPTEYGKKNVREDFAESFVQFIETPQKMAEKGLYRMKRTLWLSGFGNKPVMRLAQKRMAARIASRYLRGER